VPKYLLYGQQQNYPLHQQKKLKWLPQNTCNKMPRFMCPPSLLYKLYGSIQYGLSNSRNSAPTKQKILLGFVPKNSWEMCPLSSLKLTQKLSLNLLLLCLAHYPMHSFIKSKDDLFPPKYLFTFPNPKSKGQDPILPLQDQGS
jgi:hypothetical protein